MISWSSSLASSTPETSLKVTFFCELEDSFARLLPNERALFPPLCICRMMKIQKPIMSRIGAQEYSSAVHGLADSALASMTMPFSASLLASPSYCVGAYERNLLDPSPRLPSLYVPVISLPVITTLATSPTSTFCRNWENGMGDGFGRSPVENCQIRTPTTTRTIQNNRLLRVEF